MTTKLLTEATYVLSIVADSGYESTTEGRCNVQQYSAAVRALHDAAWAHEITQARADLEAENQRLRDVLRQAESKLIELEHAVSGGDDEIYVEGVILSIRAALKETP